MYQHHQDTIDNVIKRMKKDHSVLALIIAGSVAHGFAKEDSDVDIMIVVSNEEYEKRCKENKLLYYDTEDSHYEKGYVDGKYISTDFIQDVIRYGGEPARFAFKDCYFAYSSIPELEKLMTEAATYPVKYKEARMRLFFAHMHEWNWFYSQGLDKNNPYLISTAVCNIVYYGGRALLAYNMLLYPYHKWFLTVLEGAKNKPENIMLLINSVLETKSPEAVESFMAAVCRFTDWGISGSDWPNYLNANMDLGCSEASL